MIDKTRWGQRGEWYVVAQFILFGLIFISPFAFSGPGRWPSPWSALALAAGLVLGLAGGLLALAGVFTLGPNLTAVPYPKEDAVLVEKGVYCLVRHPIYAGILFGALGWGLLTNSLSALLLVLILLLLFDIKARREEAWLREKYANYTDYQRQVKKLIPFVY